MISPELTYKRTVVEKVATILAGEQNSDLVDVGGMQLLAIDIPPNFTGTSQLTFKKYRKLSDGTDCFYSIENYDGINSAALSIQNLSANRSIGFYAHWFAAASQIQLISADPQPQTVQIILCLQPIFQGIHS